MSYKIWKRNYNRDKITKKYFRNQILFWRPGYFHNLHYEYNEHISPELTDMSKIEKENFLLRCALLYYKKRLDKNKWQVNSTTHVKSTKRSYRKKNREFLKKMLYGVTKSYDDGEYYDKPYNRHKGDLSWDFW